MSAPAVIDSILDLVGHTPMLRLRRFAPDLEIFGKLEYLNPGGSIKDRIGVGMLRAAEARGELTPGLSTVIEATAGNTGLGLALACKALGYRCIIVMTTKYSQEKMQLVKALGAELVVLPKELGMDGAVARTEELAKAIPHAWLSRQYDNWDNPGTHAGTTAEEIWEQMEGRVDGIAIAAGSGGSFTGIVKRLKEKNPRLVAWCVQPHGSCYGDKEVREWKVEGIGSTSVPAVLDLSLADHILDVTDEESLATARRLIATEGCLVGGSSGCNAAAALQLARALPPGSRVVTLLCDGAERYLSKFPVADLSEELP
jgi:cysteine synthase